MKAIGVLFLAAALGSAVVDSAPNAARSSEETTLAEAIQAMLVAYQQMMPCGSEELGLPPLAPFRQDKVVLNINEEMLSLTGEITNLVVTGLNEFLVIDLSTRGNRTTFDVLYEGIDVLGEFDAKLYENLAGFQYNVKPKGLLNIHFNDIRISGGITIGENLFGGMYFEDIKYYIDIGDVVSEVLESQWSTAVNRFFNKYVRETTLLVVEENREAISDAIAAYLTPLLDVEALTTPESKFIEELAEATRIYESVQCN